MMDRINKVVKWKHIKALLKEHYEYGVGRRLGGADSPMMLLKAL
jgi:hypothetical protein